MYQEITEEMHHKAIIAALKKFQEECVKHHLDPAEISVKVSVEMSVGDEKYFAVN